MRITFQIASFDSDLISKENDILYLSQPHLLLEIYNKIKLESMGNLGYHNLCLDEVSPKSGKIN